MELLLSDPARRPIAVSEFRKVPSSTVRRRRNTAARCDLSLKGRIPSAGTSPRRAVACLGLPRTELQILAELATIGGEASRHLGRPAVSSKPLLGSSKHRLEHQWAPLILGLRSCVHNTV